MLRHPCILGVPQLRGTNLKVVAPSLPSWGPKRGRKCYITLAFLGIPNVGDKNQKWLPHPCLVGGPGEGPIAMSPVHSRGSPTPSTWRKFKSGPLQKGTKSKVAASPLPCRGPRRGPNCYVTRAFSGIPNAKHVAQIQNWPPTKGNKIKSGCLTPFFLEAQKRAEMLHHPCMLGDPQLRA